MSDQYKKHLGLLLFLAAIILAAGLGLRDPWPADEPRFALVAREMLASGDWLFPHVGGVLYPDKPPLFFWLVAALYALTESMRVSFLIPGLLAGMGVLWLVTDLARRLWTPRVAIWSGATLLALIQFPLQMKTGQLDALLCFWTTLGLYGLCRHLLAGPDWRWYTIAGLASGLGVITKGVGFLPFLIFLPYALAVNQGWVLSKIAWRDWRWSLAPIAFLVAVGIWLVPMLLAAADVTNPDLIAYRDNILLKQTVTRYTDSWGHIKPPWYLFTNAIPWLWMPVSLLLPWLIPAWRQDLKRRRPEILLLGGWILLVLLFFSLSGGKRSLYIFPAAPALAMIAGYHASQLMTRNGPRRVLFGLSLFLASSMLAGGAWLFVDATPLQQWVTDPHDQATLPWLILAIAAVLLLATAVTRIRRAPAGFAAVMTTLWIGLSVFVYPAINDVRSGKFIIDKVAAELPEGYSLGFVGWREQFLLHWDKPAVHFGYRRHDDLAESSDAANWLSGSSNRRLLLPGNMIDPCFDRSRILDVGLAHRSEWYLAGADAVNSECTAANADPVQKIVLYHSTSL